MPSVRLGNPAPNFAEVAGKTVTTATIPDSYTISECIRTLFHQDGLWVQHSLAFRPDWVECDDPVLTEAIKEHTGCQVGRPDDWERTGNAR